MTPEQLAYKLFKYREKYRLHGDAKRDYSCASYILKNEKDLPLENDWREWERVFRYHYL